MIDVSSALMYIIANTTNWTEDDPEYSSISFTSDEFNPNDPTLQICFENSDSKSTFITFGVQRIVQDCKITVYVRPVNYMPTTIDAFKSTFLNAKTQLDSILISNKWDVTGILNVDLGGWKDLEMEVGRDTKKHHKEPIVFTSEQIVKVTYYN